MTGFVPQVCQSSGVLWHDFEHLSVQQWKTLLMDGTHGARTKSWS